MKRKMKWKNLIILILVFLCVIGIIYSTISIIYWQLDNKKTNDNITKAETKIKTIDDTNAELIGEKSEEKSPNPYWDFIKMDLIDVDVNELKKQNNEVVGWIKVNGTNINYPFVQTTNNDFYLTHSFDKSYNKAGWIFLDYRNDIKDLNKNTIIYGHGRVNKTMFGSLKNILKSDWYKNKNNYVIKTVTEKESSLWQVFSVYKIKTTNDYIQTTFSSDEEYEYFLNKLLKRSYYDFHTGISTDNNIITLSTCYNNSEKVVMHAKLIKRVEK